MIREVIKEKREGIDTRLQGRVDTGRVGESKQRRERVCVGEEKERRGGRRGGKIGEEGRSEEVTSEGKG